eukprot:90332-Prymnesium_polylepis.1
MSRGYLTSNIRTEGRDVSHERTHAIRSNGRGDPGMATRGLPRMPSYRTRLPSLLGVCVGVANSFLGVPKTIRYSVQ